MVPVRAFIAAVNEVAGKEKEIRLRMAPQGRVDQAPPAFESGLSVSQVKNSDSSPSVGRRFNVPPRSPAGRCSVAQRVAIERIGLETAHPYAMAPNDRIVEKIGHRNARRLALDRSQAKRGELAAIARRMVRRPRNAHEA